MIILTLKERNYIEDAVNEYANDHQQSVWRFWFSTHPQVRCGPEDPLDDGDGPVPDALREVIVDVIHQQFDYFVRIMDSEETDDDEACLIANDAADLRSIHRAITGQYPLW